MRTAEVVAALAEFATGRLVLAGVGIGVVPVAGRLPGALLALAGVLFFPF
jgi:hypothetical protein